MSIPEKFFPVDTSIAQKSIPQPQASVKSVKPNEQKVEVATKVLLTEVSHTDESKDLPNNVHPQEKEKSDSRISLIFNKIAQSVHEGIIPGINKDNFENEEMEKLIKDNIHHLDTDEKGFIFEYKNKIFFISKPENSELKIGVVAFKVLKNKLDDNNKPLGEKLRSDNFAAGGFVKVYHVTYLDSNDQGVMKLSKIKNDKIKDEFGLFTKKGDNQAKKASEDLRSEAKLMRELDSLVQGKAVNSKVDGLFSFTGKNLSNKPEQQTILFTDKFWGDGRTYYNDFTSNCDNIEFDNTEAMDIINENNAEIIELEEKNAALEKEYIADLGNGIEELEKENPELEKLKNPKSEDILNEIKINNSIINKNKDIIKNCNARIEDNNNQIKGYVESLVEEKKHFTKVLSEGVNDVFHKHEIVHRDIKPANVLISDKNEETNLIDIVFADLGNAAKFNELFDFSTRNFETDGELDLKYFFGTGTASFIPKKCSDEVQVQIDFLNEEYKLPPKERDTDGIRMAIENIKNSLIDSDIFATGETLYILWTGSEPPFSSFKENLKCSEPLNAEIEFNEMSAKMNQWGADEKETKIVLNMMRRGMGLDIEE